jgi:hypothetical protein
MKKDFTHLQLIRPALAEEALRASGPHVGNRIIGTKILAKNLDLSLRECYNVMTDLQEMSLYVCCSIPPQYMALGFSGRLQWINSRLRLANAAYRGHGGEGPCRCLWCRIWYMWIEDLEEALSEY